MVRTRPLSSDWLKSPRRSSSVGTVRTIESGRLSSHCSNEVKEKMRLRHDRAAERAAGHPQLAAAQRRHVSGDGDAASGRCARS